MYDKHIDLAKEIYEQLNKCGADLADGSLIIIIAGIISNRLDKPVKPESGGLNLETMINNLPQNRILYKDSGLWMIIDEEDFNTTDKMLFQVARYQQTTKETFAQFIKRCFDSENGYYITEY